MLSGKYPRAFALLKNATLKNFSFISYGNRKVESEFFM